VATLLARSFWPASHGLTATGFQPVSVADTGFQPVGRASGSRQYGNRRYDPAIPMP